MKSLPRILIASLFLLTWAACGTPASTPTVGNGVDTTAADTLTGTSDPTQEYEAPTSPPAKSKAELAALDDLWTKTRASEKECLGTPRISEWVDGLEATNVTDPDDEYSYGKISKAQLKSLTAKELVYYVLFHPEYWDQICAESSYEAGLVQGISVELPFNVDYLSDDQDAEVKARIDSFQTVVVSCLRNTQAVGVEMLHLISDYRLKAAVGPLCEIYKAQSTKDDLILSGLIQLMVRAEFKPWTESELMKAEQANNRDWIPLTPVNADKIMYYAQKYAAN